MKKENISKSLKEEYIVRPFFQEIFRPPAQNYLQILQAPLSNSVKFVDPSSINKITKIIETNIIYQKQIQRLSLEQNSETIVLYQTFDVTFIYIIAIK